MTGVKQSRQLWLMGWVGLVAAVGVIFGAPACADSDIPDLGDAAAIAAREADAEAVMTRIQTLARKGLLLKENRERGWECGYAEGYGGVVFEAEERGATVWRRETLGGMMGWAIACFLLGLLGVVVAAWLLPRLNSKKVRERKEAEARRDDGASGTYQPPIWEEPPASGPSWGAYLRAVLSDWFATWHRLLRIDWFDPAAAEMRGEAITECRETVRCLTRARLVVTGAVSQAQGAASEEAREALLVELKAWSMETEAMAVHLDRGMVGTHTQAQLSAQRLLPHLVRGRRSAQRLRAGVFEALVATGSKAPVSVERWERWVEAAKGRLLVSSEIRQRRAVKPLADWVKPAGWASLVGMALSLPMIAAWFAAGAFPFFLAWLVSTASIGVMVVARAHLFHAGRQPLLPGLSDHVARWLTALTAFALAAMFASNWASSESGLDLGDPPPIHDGLAAPVAPPQVPVEGRISP